MLGRDSWFQAQSGVRFIEEICTFLVILLSMLDPLIEQLIERRVETVDRRNCGGERNRRSRLRLQVIRQVEIKRSRRNLGDTLLAKRRHEQKRGARQTMQAFVRGRSNKVDPCSVQSKVLGSERR